MQLHPSLVLITCFPRPNFAIARMKWQYVVLLESIYATSWIKYTPTRSNDDFSYDLISSSVVSSVSLLGQTIRSPTSTTLYFAQTEFFYVQVLFPSECLKIIQAQRVLEKYLRRKPFKSSKLFFVKLRLKKSSQLS